MPHSDNNPSHSDELLSAKLRQLGRSSAAGASPEVEGLLVNAFHRRHRRRKVLRIVPIVAVLMLIVGGSLWRWSGSDHRQPAKQFMVATPRPAPQAPSSINE